MVRQRSYTTLTRITLFLAAMTISGCASGQTGSGPSPAPTPSGPEQATIKVGQRAGVAVAGQGAIWVPNTGDGTVSRIDPSTNRVVATITIGNQLAFYQRECEAKGSVHSFMGTSFHVRDCDLPSALATGTGALWVLKNDDQTVLRIDPTSRRVLARIALGFVPFDIAATDKAVWISGYWEDQLVRVDPSTNQVVARLTLPDGASGIAASDQAVWVASTIAGVVSRVDPSNNRVIATVRLDCPTECYQGSMPLAVTTTSDAAWIRTVGDGLLVRIDPNTNRAVATVDVSYSLGRSGQDHLGVLDGLVWVAGSGLQRVDPTTNRVTGLINVDATGVTSGFGSLWVTALSGRILRIQPTV
jgi:YVTN family beta-propeller protein